MPAAGPGRGLVVGDLRNVSAGGDINIVANLAPRDAVDRGTLQVLLQRVRRFWLDGVLSRALDDGAPLEVDTEPLPSAVVHPWSQVTEVTPEVAPDTPIVERFLDSERSLLILGEPGAGKTTLLLRICEALAGRADANPGEPIPVVFHLAGWPGPGSSLGEWLVGELSTKYQIPARAGRQLVDAGCLLPLLDGLDEVRAEHRPGCVEAINGFFAEGRAPGLVVSSRREEYEALPARLGLASAVGLSKLSEAQVVAYLDQAGEDLSGLRDVLRTDAALRQQATSPLMLKVMRLAYAGAPATSPGDGGEGSPETRRQRLFDTYVDRAFARKGEGGTRYSRDRVLGWLRWLARRMLEHNQSEFLIEGLQPGWLSRPGLRWLYVLACGLLFGLAIGIIAGGFWELTRTVWGNWARQSIELYRPWWLVATPLWGVAIMVLDGLWRGPLGARDPTGARTRMSLTGHVARWLLQGLVWGLILAAIWWFHWGGPTNVSRLTPAAVTGVIVVSFVVAWGSRLPSLAGQVSTFEALGWSWGGCARGAGWGLLAGACLLGVWLVVNVILGGGWTLSGALAFGAPFTVMGMVVGAAFGALVGRTLPRRVAAYQGMALAARNAGIAALLGGLAGAAVGLGFWALPALTSGGPAQAGIAPWLALGFGWVLGATAALWYGGADIGKHYILRALLYLEDAAPPRYGRFLDYASHLALLRRVGGGYIFTHRLLLVHLAEGGR